MEVLDKSVSTDDISYPLPHNTFLEVARLEAVLNTLVEHKVAAIKNDSVPGIIASPKSLTKRHKINSTSTASSKEKTSESHSVYSNRKHRRRNCRDDSELSRKRARMTGRSKQRICSSSPESNRYNVADRTPPMSEDDVFIPLNNYAAKPCCCVHNMTEVHLNTIQPFTEDYIALKIEEYDEFEMEIDEYEASRARRKRRKRRRKMRRMKSMSVAVIEEIKIIDPDELPQKARWTIVATACILLFMCLMLVGVTLRMAPLIDDMVRKENEALMNSLHREDAVESPTPHVPVS